jgi:exopolyphosphatase / guanosine-5'-triphosphate,3'-diphosphate pyrophosphatase
MTSVLGIIDLGSHSVRLVVYRRVGGYWLSIYNEKATCTLGKSLSQSGVLDEAGKEKVRQTLARFCGIARAFALESLTILATAAMRTASDGRAFAAELEERFGTPIRIINGDEESAYAAAGLLRCYPEADGLMGDMGGSSLELATVAQGKTSVWGTLPFGVLSIADIANKDITDRLKDLSPDNVASVSGKPFYAIGGSWRALARYAQHVTDYPLKTPHLFSLPRESVLAHAEDILDKKKMPRKVPGVNRDRLELLPAAAKMLQCLLKVFTCDRVIFCAYGVRDGYLWQQHETALHGSSREERAFREGLAYAEYIRLLSPHWQALHDWIQPLFPSLSARQALVLKLACLLTDGAAWEGEGKSVKGTLAVDRMIGAPLFCLTHAEKMLLALVLYASYTGEDTGKAVAGLLPWIAPEERRFALKLGTALRLARALVSDQYGLLAQVPLQGGETPILVFPAASLIQTSETVERRLTALYDVFQPQVPPTI